MFQRKIINLDACELVFESDAAWAALVEWAETHGDDPPVVARGPVLMRVEDESLTAVSETMLRGMLAHSAQWHTTSQTNPFIPRMPPYDHVKYVLELDARRTGVDPSTTKEIGRLRDVEFITDVPIISSDGSLICDPGLHKSGAWYRPSPDLADVTSHVGDVNDVDDVIEARDLLLDDLLGSFDFVDDMSRANALGLVLLPFVREYIGNSPTPLHAVIAPQPGSGKTTLVETCLIPGLGSVDVSVEPKDEEELRKKITAELMAGSRAVFFDNLSQELASAFLAAALTSTRWKDRVLGKSNIVSLPNKLIWLATGNNMATSSELKDRVCPIWLEPPNGVPARMRPTSSFKHKDIRRWALDNRARLVGACMTLILHWLEGSAVMLPDGSFHREEENLILGPTMGSFNVWSETIGGILRAADVQGFLQNREQLEVVDLGEHETSTFLARIFAWSDGEEFATRDLVPMCLVGGPLYDYVPNSVGSLSHNPGHRLGRWLAGCKDSTYDGVRLRMRTVKGGLSAWSVESV